MRVNEICLTANGFVMGGGASFTVSIVSSTTHSFVDKWKQGDMGAIAESNLLTKHDKGPLRESRTPTEISIGVYRREGRVGRENTAEQKPAAR